MGHRLPRPIKPLKGPHHLPFINLGRFNNLFTKPKTYPQLLVRHLIHPICMCEHVIKYHKAPADYPLPGTYEIKMGPVVDVALVEAELLLPLQPESSSSPHDSPSQNPPQSCQ